MPNPQTPYFLEVDASEVATGAILSQQAADGLLHPVAYCSKKLSPAEINYDIGDHELLAIKRGLEEWRHLLEGASHPITVYTDHKTLSICVLPNASNQDKPAGLSFSLALFFMSPTDRLKKIGKADALSRIHHSCSIPSIPSSILPSKGFLGIIHPVCDKIRTLTATTSLTVNPEGLHIIRDRIFVPEEACFDVLHTCHDSPQAGHPGIRATLDLILRQFWWPSVEHSVKQYVQSCPTCLRTKVNHTKTAGLLCPLPVPNRPWTQLTMDFIVDLPPSKGFNTIMVVVDRLTKMAHFIPNKKLPTARETASLFFTHIFRLHGIPDTMTTDRGTQFTSKFWKAFCSLLHIQRNLSSSFHPQTNGQTERVNQILEQHLRCYTSFLQDDWLDLLPSAEFSYNSRKHSSIHSSPFYVNYGFHPTAIPNIPVTTTVPEATNRLLVLKKGFLLAAITLQAAQEAYKRAADKRRRPAPDFQIGDMVLLSTKNLQLPCPSKKLGPKFVGPFRIIKKINSVAFRLQLPDSYKIHPVFHVSLFKSYHPDPFIDRSPAPPPPSVVSDSLEYEIVRILDSRLHRGGLQYYVHWKGYGPEERSWEPVQDVHAPALLRAFHRLHLRRPGPDRSRGALLRGGSVTPQRGISATSGPTWCRLAV
uniref:Gypsy retrotransposon integrase-like protein 1 n=1 Tax=Leptobrachium leishanense TaxID=445787 RepID=A0A8C5MDR7_9ANUR